MSKYTKDMVQAGYCASPNANFHGEVGREWYPAGPQIPEPPHNHRVHVADDGLRVYETIGKPDPRNPGYNIFDAVERGFFETVDSFIEWCKEHGQISQPGLPAYANSWD